MNYPIYLPKMFKIETIVISLFFIHFSKIYKNCTILDIRVCFTFHTKIKKMYVRNFVSVCYFVLFFHLGSERRSKEIRNKNFKIFSHLIMEIFWKILKIQTLPNKFSCSGKKTPKKF